MVRFPHRLEAQTPNAMAEPPFPECPICYEEYDLHTHVPLKRPCGHVFCAGCLQACLHQECPLCREPAGEGPVRLWADDIRRFRKRHLNEAVGKSDDYFLFGPTTTTMEGLSHPSEVILRTAFSEDTATVEGLADVLVSKKDACHCRSSEPTGVEWIDKTREAFLSPDNKDARHFVGVFKTKRCACLCSLKGDVGGFSELVVDLLANTPHLAMVMYEKTKEPHYMAIAARAGNVKAVMATNVPESQLVLVNANDRVDVLRAILDQKKQQPPGIDDVIPESAWDHFGDLFFASLAHRAISVATDTWTDDHSDSEFRTATDLCNLARDASLHMKDPSAVRTNCRSVISRIYFIHIRKACDVKSIVELYDSTNGIHNAVQFKELVIILFEYTSKFASVEKPTKDMEWVGLLVRLLSHMTDYVVMYEPSLGDCASVCDACYFICASTIDIFTVDSGCHGIMRACDAIHPRCHLDGVGVSSKASKFYEVMVIMDRISNRPLGAAVETRDIATLGGALQKLPYAILLSMRYLPCRIIDRRYRVLIAIGYACEVVNMLALAASSVRGCLLYDVFSMPGSNGYEEKTSCYFIRDRFLNPDVCEWASSISVTPSPNPGTYNMPTFEFATENSGSSPMERSAEAQQRPKKNKKQQKKKKRKPKKRAGKKSRRSNRRKN